MKDEALIRDSEKEHWPDLPEWSKVLEKEYFDHLRQTRRLPRSRS